MSEKKPKTHVIPEQSKQNISSLADSILVSGLNLFAVGMIGVGVGWLLGLSVSPVVANVVAVIIAAAATLVATMGGWDKHEGNSPDSNQTDNEKNSETLDAQGEASKATMIETPQTGSKRIQVNFPRLPRVIAPWPFACLMIGVLVGSSLGLCARNHSWFGSSLSYEVETWTDQGLPKDEVVRRLFELQYPYTPYVQSWLRITDTLPISSSQSLTDSQIILSSPISSEVGMWVDLGIDHTSVVSRFFELKYPFPISSSFTFADQPLTSEIPRDIDKAAGFNTGAGNAQANSEICASYRNRSWDKLKNLLEIEETLNTMTEDSNMQNDLLAQIFKPLCP